MRYAAIDIGSNAIRLLIADLSENSEPVTFKKNTLLRVPLRLGDDAFIQKKISEKKINDLVKTMHSFRLLMDVYGVSAYLACATSAMRESENGPEIVKQVKEQAGVDLEIVGGQREAKIIYASHFEEKLDRKKNYLYIDVGGGSTELSFFSDEILVASQSFNIGTIRMLDNQDKAETWKEMERFIQSKVKSHKNITGIGTGGNINKLFRLSEEKEGKPMSLSKLKSLYNHLNSYSMKDRIQVLGLNHDRADVIIPAAQIFITVMKWAGVANIYVPKVGMVDGIIQILIEENFK
ncbi:exopolyphosphatase [uncultured Mucilaginibacter sp.]|uniref:Ppx/GppA phosphatase family protein n=1 Tax=uncultured Mucilaginibacter sp. TaxID=797541 RepID=UPI00263332CE|nr:exopolyphosphatase [uncultured Mucilaginibacter sp.]